MIAPVLERRLKCPRAVEFYLSNLLAARAQMHPLEYDETPEGRISAEAREIIVWMYEEQKKGNPRVEYPMVPDFRDMYDHLKYIIRLEMIKVEAKYAIQDWAVRQRLAEAEEQLAVERAMREKHTPRGERR